MSTYLGDTLIAGVGRHTESNAHNLLDFKWSDHIINSMEWLRSDTFSWQSGDVYASVYQHLVADISGKSLQSETISGITIQFYLTDDGHKICPASQESKVASLYNAIGVAWYYILDTVNTRFKLPRNIDVSNTIIDYTNPINISSGTTSTVYGLFYISGHAHNGQETVQLNGTTVYLGGNYGTERLSGDCILCVKPGDVISWSNWNDQVSMARIYPVKKIDDYVDNQHKYLYFYVGQFSQSATEQTAGLNAELFNQKADKSDVWSKDTIMSWFSPDISAGVSKSFNTDYVADVSGLLVFYGGGKSNNYPYAIINGTNTNFRGGSTERGDNPSNGGNFIPVTKGQTYKIGGSSSYSSIVFYPYKGETS